MPRIPSHRVSRFTILIAAFAMGLIGWPASVYLHIAWSGWIAAGLMTLAFVWVLVPEVFRPTSDWHHWLRVSILGVFCAFGVLVCAVSLGHRKFTILPLFKELKEHLTLLIALGGATVFGLVYESVKDESREEPASGQRPSPHKAARWLPRAILFGLMATLLGISAELWKGVVADNIKDIIKESTSPREQGLRNGDIETLEGNAIRSCLDLLLDPEMAAAQHVAPVSEDEKTVIRHIAEQLPERWHREVELYARTKASIPKGSTQNPQRSPALSPAQTSSTPADMVPPSAFESFLGASDSDLDVRWKAMLKTWAPPKADQKIVDSALDAVGKVCSAKFKIAVREWYKFDATAGNGKAAAALRLDLEAECVTQIRKAYAQLQQGELATEVQAQFDLLEQARSVCSQPDTGSALEAEALLRKLMRVSVTVADRVNSTVRAAEKISDDVSWAAQQVTYLSNVQRVQQATLTDFADRPNRLVRSDELDRRIQHMASQFGGDDAILRALGRFAASVLEARISGSTSDCTAALNRLKDLHSLAAPNELSTVLARKLPVHRALFYQHLGDLVVVTGGLGLEAETTLSLAASDPWERASFCLQVAKSCAIDTVEIEYQEIRLRLGRPLKPGESRSERDQGAYESLRQLSNAAGSTHRLWTAIRLDEAWLLARQLNRGEEACRLFGDLRLAGGTKNGVGDNVQVVEAAVGGIYCDNVRYPTMRDKATALEPVVQSAPDHALAHLYLGWCLEPLRDRASDAEHHFRRALQLDPFSVGAKYNLAGLLVGRKEYENEALRLAHDAIDLSEKQGHPEPVLVLARLRAQDPANWEEVCAKARKVQALRPDDANLSARTTSCVLDLWQRMHDANWDPKQQDEVLDLAWAVSASARERLESKESDCSVETRLLVERVVIDAARLQREESSKTDELGERERYAVLRVAVSRLQATIEKCGEGKGMGGRTVASPADHLAVALGRLALLKHDNPDPLENSIDVSMNSGEEAVNRPRSDAPIASILEALARSHLGDPDNDLARKAELEALIWAAERTDSSWEGEADLCNRLEQACRECLRLMTKSEKNEKMRSLIISGLMSLHDHHFRGKELGETWDKHLHQAMSLCPAPNARKDGDSEYSLLRATLLIGAARLREREWGVERSRAALDEADKIVSVSLAESPKSSDAKLVALQLLVAQAVLSKPAGDDQGDASARIDRALDIVGSLQTEERLAEMTRIRLVAGLVTIVEPLSINSDPEKLSEVDRARLERAVLACRTLHPDNAKDEKGIRSFVEFLQRNVEMQVARARQKVDIGAWKREVALRAERVWRMDSHELRKRFPPTQDICLLAKIYASDANGAGLPLVELAQFERETVAEKAEMRHDFVLMRKRLRLASQIALARDESTQVFGKSPSRPALSKQSVNANTEIAGIVRRLLDAAGLVEVLAKSGDGGSKAVLLSQCPVWLALAADVADRACASDIDAIEKARATVLNAVNATNDPAVILACYGGLAFDARLPAAFRLVACRKALNAASLPGDRVEMLSLAELALKDLGAMAEASGTLDRLIATDMADPALYVLLAQSQAIDPTVGPASRAAELRMPVELALPSMGKFGSTLGLRRLDGNAIASISNNVAHANRLIDMRVQEWTKRGINPNEVLSTIKVSTALAALYSVLPGGKEGVVHPLTSVVDGLDKIEIPMVASMARAKVLVTIDLLSDRYRRDGDREMEAKLGNLRARAVSLPTAAPDMKREGVRSASESARTFE